MSSHRGIIGADSRIRLWWINPSSKDLEKASGGDQIYIDLTEVRLGFAQVTTYSLTVAWVTT